MNSLPTTRYALIGDLKQIIDLLDDDELGKSREVTSDLSIYEKAFHAILSDPNHFILIIEENKILLGCVQVSYLPNLTFKGSWRAQLEGVRIARKYRGKGLGKQLLSAAISCAIERGCKIIQLTTNRDRLGVTKFYESLGFQDTHTGMKLYID